MATHLPSPPSLNGPKRLAYLGAATCLLLLCLTRAWTAWITLPHDLLRLGLNGALAVVGLWLLRTLLVGSVPLETLERLTLRLSIPVYLALNVQTFVHAPQSFDNSGVNEVVLVALGAACYLFLPPAHALRWTAAVFAGHLISHWWALGHHLTRTNLSLQLARDLTALVAWLLIMLLATHRTAWAEARESARAMRDMAHTDDLTGLPNRRAAYRRFEEAMQGPQTPVSVLLIDIDNFKRVNDTHGHETGDQVIQAVTAALQGELGHAGVLVRWGGEEFLALLVGVTLGHAARQAEALRAAVERLGIRHGPVTVSVGVSGRVARDTVESLVHRADQGLYRAKNTGKNKVVVQED
ncbi:hypothetical protein DKM44_02520 [Deinococcus irradiatisoli]|uniref:GGDEF domain-containing protein n=1 Tax=Deinococcus irradiatisoli TaxID=2202254 RepID=A0A2Z3JH27_9DEIO|nr:GGDEF domain-containing protein [Deinococcus irradiatisoli]AWN22249.1 hypothetical protein DKM44_02520 [Deinococcus irradiatisoli]